MHSCPGCGQACYCNGDIDDVELEASEENCTHDCDEYDSEELWDEEEPWF